MIALFKMMAFASDEDELIEKAVEALNEYKLLKKEPPLFELTLLLEKWTSVKKGITSLEGVMEESKKLESMSKVMESMTNNSN